MLLLDRSTLGIAGIVTVVMTLTMAMTARAQEGLAYDDKLKSLLAKFCFDCHAQGSTAGDFDMDLFKTSKQMTAGTKTWEKAVGYARAHIMPPPEADHQPSPDERDQLINAIQRVVYKIDPSKPDPGRVTIRRLNSEEYRNTIRDLTGVTFDTTHEFPPDDTGYGFDNIGDVLTLPPMLFEKYLAATEKILDQAIVTDAIQSRERRVPATQATQAPALEITSDGFARLTSEREDALSVQVQVRTPADYVVRVLAFAQRGDATTRPTGNRQSEPIKLSLMMNNTVVTDVEITANQSKPQWVEARIGAPVGRANFAASVRRLRGHVEDKTFGRGRPGIEQSGAVFIKEIIVIGPVEGGVTRFNAQRLRTVGSALRENDSVMLPTSDDEAIATFDVGTPGEYLLRANVQGTYAGDEPPLMDLLLDGKVVKSVAVNASASFSPPEGSKPAPDARKAVPQVYEVRAKLREGEHRFSAKFLNDAYFPEHPDPNYRDRNLAVQYLEVVDLDAPACPPMAMKMRTLFVKHAGETAAVGNAAIKHDPAIARALLAEFVLHAWRRPAKPDELDRVVRLYALAKTNGLNFHESIKHAMKGVLVSSNFLFRGETESPANAPGPNELIGEYELASRLSYFLWSTMPDEELLTLAGRGELRKQLSPQVKRMLASPKFKSFTNNFAGQWLQFRNLDAAHPDKKMFPAYTDQLRDAMQRETQMFVESILRDDRNLMEFLTAEYTFVNELLARHYGIVGVGGKEFRRVSLKGTGRRGILTQGSVLTLTSNPTRTSPVKRGKWVMESLLGTAPPPPPPDIPPLVEPGKRLTGTVRKQLEAHRDNPNCSACHAAMDPIGFALENFNAIGVRREFDGDGAIDASSAFPDGNPFTGAIELSDVLVNNRGNDFLRSVTEHTLTFALGRGVEPFDQPAVDKIIADLRKNDQKFTTLVFGVVNSVPFQMRRTTQIKQADAGFGR